MVKFVTIYELKIGAYYYKEVITYKKTFEIRKNDRNLQVGDKYSIMILLK